jgi:hypothetical protein
MRSLISALAAAGFLVFSLSAYSADEAKPGRAIEENVKTKADASRPGRTAEEEKAVKSSGASDKPGRTVEKQ